MCLVLSMEIYYIIDSNLMTSQTSLVVCALFEVLTAVKLMVAAVLFSCAFAASLVLCDGCGGGNEVECVHV